MDSSFASQNIKAVLGHWRVLWSNDRVYFKAKIPLYWLDGLDSNFQEMFLRVPSFASDKNFDRTRSVGHGQ